MVGILVALAIIISFALRPFAYKPASKELSPQIASYFTAVWCLAFAIPTLPFCWHYFFAEDKILLFHWAIIFPIIKGYTLYLFLKTSQIVNKENTSGNVFWGVIALAISALITTFIFNIPLSTNKLIVILLIGILGLLFFIIGEGKKLSKKGKKAFFWIVFSVVVNILCDSLTIKYLNWYILFVIPYISMLFISMIATKKTIPIRQFFTTKNILIAGITFAVSEIIVIFSMQMFFSVIVVNFMLRISQGLDLIFAYHLHKEGEAKVQYFFAIGIIVLSYFFFFT